MKPHPHWGHTAHEKADGNQDEQDVVIPLHPRQPYQHWQPGSHPPEWGQHAWPRPSGRRRIFVRFVGGIIFLVLLVGGGLVLASHFWPNVGNLEGRPPVFFFWRFCGVVLLVPILLWIIGRRIFRSYGVPLADIMDAADEVATGNLKVRVQERGSRDFQRLASSFNRMTAELARVEEQRRNLTADVAHELRTPLHIIQGNLEGILDGVYSPTPEHIDATLQETRTLARLVDDLRTLSLAESGQLPMHPETIDVHDLLADVATSFSPQAESAGVQLVVQADESQPLTLYGDPGRLDQVLNNLVSNALRHTPANGRILLGATLVRNGAGEAVQLTVADTGEGIAPDDLPFIFDRFWRGDRARTHKEGTGSGLGLAITGQLVRAHGGTITVASTPGEGTTFTLTLPSGITKV
jgi:signal transduction histidine kinase